MPWAESLHLLYWVQYFYTWHIVLFNYGLSRMSCILSRYLCLCCKVKCIVCSLRGVSLEVLGQLFKNDTCNTCFTVEIHPCETRVFWFHFRKKQRKWKEKKCILFVQEYFKGWRNGCLVRIFESLHQYWKMFVCGELCSSVHVE